MRFSIDIECMGGKVINKNHGKLDASQMIAIVLYGIALISSTVKLD